MQNVKIQVAASRTYSTHECAHKMASWDDLPEELILLILDWRRELTMLPRAAAQILKTWHGYRTRVLLGRFRMLRYLHDFRTWNPSAASFLRRAKL